MAKKHFIEVTETEETQVADVTENQEIEEVKEESKMSKFKGFVKDHKKGLIIGAVATGLAAVAGVIVGRASADEDDDEFYDEEDYEFDDEDIESDADEAPATES